MKEILWVCFGHSGNAVRFEGDLIDAANFVLSHHQSPITMFKWNDGGYLETNEFQNADLISIHWGEADGAITRPLKRSEREVFERYIKEKQSHGNN